MPTATYDPVWAQSFIDQMMGRMQAGLSGSNANRDVYQDYQRWINSNPVQTAQPTPAPTTPAPVVDPNARANAIAAARAAALERITRGISDRGLDINTLLPSINTELDEVAAGISPTTDLGIAFSNEDALIDRVTNQYQDNQRRQLLGQVDSNIGVNYGDRTIQSSLLDDTISSILGEQRGSAQQFLDRGRARGIYNEDGYNAGMRTLTSAEQAARARLNTLGSDVLNGYRDQANEVRDAAYEGASNFVLGRNFDLNRYIESGNQVLGRAQQNAAGDLRGALGGERLFDFSNLAQNVGQAQGAVNLRDTDVATALAERRRRNSLGRGLGSQGAF